MYLNQLLILTFGLSNCLAYSSVEKLKTALRIDQNVAEVLIEHLNSIESYKTLVNQYLEEYMLLKIQNGNPVENPLFSYQIIRRLVLNRKQIFNEFNKMSSDLLKDLEKAIEEQEMTYEDNLTEAGEGILRLQETYLLHPHDLLEGKLKDVQSLSSLTISDCLFLAKVAEEGLKYDMYAEWTEEAHSLCLKRAPFVTCSQFTLPLYESARLRHDETRHRLLNKEKSNQSVKEYVETDSEEIDDDALTTVLPNATSVVEPSKQCSQLIKMETFLWDSEQTRLCYKGSLLNGSEASKLYCYYLSRLDDVYTTLHRYKIEVRSLSPRIVTIFDVLSEEEAELIKLLATPKLRRSKVINSGAAVVSKIRVSETGWLSDREHPKLPIISKRIESITGLTVLGNSELLQVVNYGLGGMYHQHYDFFQSGSNASNNLSAKTERYATFILYLNDVRLGGATVFPRARVSVPAVKRSATFWHNLNPIGLPDLNTLHAGCPVLYGSKWIANKWILNHGQMFKKKCPLEQPTE